MENKQRSGRGGPRRKKGSAVPIEVSIGDTSPSTLAKEDANIILHLNCNSSGAPFADDGSPDHQPDPFDCTGLEFSPLNDREDTLSNPETLKMQRLKEIECFKHEKSTAKTAGTNGCHPTSIQLLSDFFKKSASNDWPMTTTVLCHWCCHGFDTVPVGIPVRYSEGKYYVTHCFCSFSCAMAFNINDTNDSIDERLVRNNMIHSLAMLYGHGSVRPAPSRYSLQVFGGNMSIDEFRSFSKNSSIEQNKHLVHSTPPMQSLREYMEELTDSDVTSGYRYIPIDKERVSKYQNKIKLMRSKPLVKYKNTIDHSMNLKYSECV
jgi:hypothetical protein